MMPPLATWQNNGFERVHNFALPDIQESTVAEHNASRVNLGL